MATIRRAYRPIASNTLESFFLSLSLFALRVCVTHCLLSRTLSLFIDSAPTLCTRELISKCTAQRIGEKSFCASPSLWTVSSLSYFLGERLEKIIALREFASLKKLKSVSESCHLSEALFFHLNNLVWMMDSIIGVDRIS